MTTGARHCVAGIFIFCLTAPVLTAAEPGGLIVEVDAGASARQATPVFLRVADEWGRDGRTRMVRLDTGEDVPVQLVPATPPTLAWTVRDLPAGATRRYRLQRAEGSGSGNVTVVDDGEGVTIRVRGRPALRYNHAEVAAPAGIDPVYRRSGQIHPLYAPSGAVVTDDFPPDHPHQHGLFFAWVNTTFDGHRVDFWNQKERTGRVRHIALVEHGSGPVFGHFTARLRHEDTSQAGAPAAVLDEEWRVRVYDRSDVFVVDLESIQTCVAPKALQINKYHYGGFGLRGNRQWFDNAVKGDAPPGPQRSGRSDFLTSEGKRRSDGNHSRPRWVDLAGDVDGKPCGVAVFDDPANYGYPQPVRLHPNKPYFCFAPCVLGGFALEPGRPYVSRYRLVLHEGRPDVAMLERLWRDFAEPPRARVVAE